MCRLFAYWGKRPGDLYDFLVAAPNSLLKQSRCDNSARPNADGWGVCYFRDGAPSLVKDPLPAFEDPLFLKTAQSLRSNLVLAHVRRLSQGPICEENTHPFVKDGWAFMHNGNIPGFQQLREVLVAKIGLPESYRPQGNTDSEFIFGCLLYQIHQLGNVNGENIVPAVEEMLSKLSGYLPHSMKDETVLNFLMTNGQLLVGYRHKRSMFYRSWKDGIIISSEALDRSSNWQAIPEGDFILCSQPDEVKLVPAGSRVLSS